jgi:UDP-3-O-acyl-N-acetylglucosamine deacetylase
MKSVERDFTRRTIIGIGLLVAILAMIVTFKGYGQDNVLIEIGDNKIKLYDGVKAIYFTIFNTVDLRSPEEIEKGIVYLSFEVFCRDNENLDKVTLFLSEDRNYLRMYGTGREEMIEYTIVAFR